MTSKLSFPSHNPTSPKAILQDASDALAFAKRELGGLLAVPQGEGRTLENTLIPWNRIAIALKNVDAETGLLASVHPDAKVRSAADEAVRKIAAFVTELYLQPELFRAFSTVDTYALDTETKYFIQKELLQFRLTGADKPAHVRRELARLDKKSVQLGQAFSKTIRDDVRAVMFDAADLDGLPDDYRRLHPADAKGRIRITTTYPDYMPFMKYAKNGAARKKLYLQFLNRAWPKNDRNFLGMLAVRRQQANLIGFKDWADCVTADKMTGSAQTVLKFLAQVVKLTAVRERADYRRLLARKRKDDPKAKFVGAYEAVYYENVLVRETIGIDAQEVRNYFQFANVKAGVFRAAERLFGLSFRKAKVTAWHKDVEVYDVHRGAVLIGRFYLDLHPRAGKYNHAACFELVPGVAGVQLPESALVCNFSRDVMEYSDVTTFFHEFGHLMHAILGGDQAWAAFSGFATERDFVEAPSQMFEEWAWDVATVQSFAKHAKTGAPISEEMISGMRRADDFAKGLWQRRQVFQAMLSLHYHREKISKTSDLLRIQKREQKKYTLLEYVPGTHFYANFGHLGGYSAVYYTYLWSHAIGFDLFSVFKKKGLYDKATAPRYAEKILMPGGSKPARELVHDFLGREWNLGEFKKWLKE